MCVLGWRGGCVLGNWMAYIPMFAYSCTDYSYFSCIREDYRLKSRFFLLLCLPNKFNSIWRMFGAALAANPAACEPRRGCSAPTVRFPRVFPSFFCFECGNNLLFPAKKEENHKNCCLLNKNSQLGNLPDYV